MRDKADFLFFMDGDTVFSEVSPRGWLGDFLDKCRKEGVIGANVCHRGWENGPYWTQVFRETNDFWITDHTPDLAFELGVTLSDRAFLVPVSPPVPYDFCLDKEDIRKYARIWPARAIPCFEMSCKKYFSANSLAFGILKPINGMPLAKHKNVKGFFRRILRQRIFGRYYANGKYGTTMSKNAS